MSLIWLHNILYEYNIDYEYNVYNYYCNIMIRLCTTVWCIKLACLPTTKCGDPNLLPLSGNVVGNLGYW
jgi:hypothetical protein